MKNRLKVIWKEFLHFVLVGLIFIGLGVLGTAFSLLMRFLGTLFE